MGGGEVGGGDVGGGDVAGGLVVAGCPPLGGFVRRIVVGVERRTVVCVLVPSVVVVPSSVVGVVDEVVVVDELVVVERWTTRRKGRPVVAPLGQPAMATPRAAHTARSRTMLPRRPAKPPTSMPESLGDATFFRGLPTPLQRAGALLGPRPTRRSRPPFCPKGSGGPLPTLLQHPPRRTKPQVRRLKRGPASATKRRSRVLPRGPIFGGRARHTTAQRGTEAGPSGPAPSCRSRAPLCSCSARPRPPTRPLRRRSRPPPRRRRRRPRLRPRRPSRRRPPPPQPVSRRRAASARRRRA